MHYFVKFCNKIHLRKTISKNAAPQHFQRINRFGKYLTNFISAPFCVITFHQNGTVMRRGGFPERIISEIIFVPRRGKTSTAGPFSIIKFISAVHFNTDLRKPFFMKLKNAHLAAKAF